MAASLPEWLTDCRQAAGKCGTKTKGRPWIGLPHDLHTYHGRV